MPTRIRPSPELREQLRRVVERDRQTPPDGGLDAAQKLFGRYGSGDAPTTRSADRKALVRERVQGKHRRT